MRNLNLRGACVAATFLYATLSAQTSDSLKSTTIDEVVVTAYGVKKERKALGYVYQDVSGATLSQAKEPNVTNALVGKVTGLQLIKSTGGPAASSKIVLRGFNSLAGDNQPLIVVDGVPMENFVGSKQNDFWNPGMDMGNGLSDINPEDIENIVVLKGGAASALYGARAGNGIIMITTKSGKGNRKGAGIVYSSTVSFSDMMASPDVQRSFSQGVSGLYGADSGVSWGAAITGQTVQNYKQEDEILKSHDNLSSFFKTGVTDTHTVSFQNNLGNDNNLYTSLSYLSDKNMIPETGYKRFNGTARFSSKFGENKRWFSDIKVQYINSDAKNRPVGGQNVGNYYSTLLTLPTTVNINNFRSGMDVLGAKQYWYVPNGDNPYWNVYNRLNEDSRNRFLLNANLKYSFTDWLNLDMRAGSDMYFTKYQQRVYTGGNLRNYYYTGQDRFFENNYIASLNARKDDLIGKWGGAVSVYGQIMTRDFYSNSVGLTLDIPNYFVASNNAGQHDVTDTFSEKQINSLFATAEINYDGYWFINGTIRNDWSSTMSKKNRSYLYPSISTSLVITDMLRKLGDQTFDSSFLTFAKIRASYATTGNDLDPYNLYNQYSIGHDPNGNLIANSRDVLYDDNVQNELLKTFEVGANFKFLRRIELDVNYYNTRATNQLINLPMNPLSGYKFKKINAGEIQNKGIEVIVNADFFKSDAFSWNSRINFSKNINNIVSLHPDASRITLGGYDTVGIYAYEGQRYGTIMGTTYQRVTNKDSQHFGKILLGADGLPMANTTPEILGDQTPRALVGFTNSFQYKNFSLSVQIDGRFGGKFFSGTQRALLASGLDPDTVIDGKRDNIVVDGVVANGSDYVANTVAVSPEVSWTAVTGRGGNLGINEAFVHDATNIRLRNVSLSYNFPKSLLPNSVLQSVRVSASVNNAFMIYSKLKGIDPEATYAVGTNAVGFENLSFPSSRSYVFNLTLGF